jgi:hypothetical protein
MKGDSAVSQHPWDAGLARWQITLLVHMTTVRLLVGLAGS